MTGRGSLWRKTFDQATVEYTDVDLNSTGTTTLYDPNSDVRVFSVTMENGGSTVEYNLELTDGTNTAVLIGVPNSRRNAGDAIAWGDTIVLSGDDSIQLNVTTVEGSALTETVSVTALEY